MRFRRLNRWPHGSAVKSPHAKLVGVAFVANRSLVFFLFIVLFFLSSSSSILFAVPEEFFHHSIIPVTREGGDRPVRMGLSNEAIPQDLDGRCPESWRWLSGLATSWWGPVGPERAAWWGD